MSTESVTPDLQADGGVLLGADSDAQPRWGERAQHIRLLHDRFPAMPPSVIADKVGCDPSNVTRVINRYVKAVSLEELQDFQGNKADIFDAIQHRALASITETHYTNASLQQLVTTAAILEDKSRLVRGQPTAIHVHALVNVLDAIAEMREQRGE